MSVPFFQQVASPPDQIEGEAVAAFFFLDDRPLAGACGLLDWRLNGQLTSLIQQGKASGQVGEQLWMQANGKLRAPWVLFVGGGERASFGDARQLKSLVSQLLSVAESSGIKRLVLGLDPIDDFGQADCQRLLEEALQKIGPATFQCLVTLDRSWVKR